MKFTDLFFIFILVASLPALASVQVNDLGLKIDYARAPMEKFDSSITRIYVGTCNGEKYTDSASLEGCERMLEASRMNIQSPLQGANSKPIFMPGYNPLNSISAPNINFR